MAKYDRRLLVPYLQDVCSVELLCDRVARNLNASQSAFNTAQTQAARTAKPVKKPNLLLRLSWIICGIIIIARLVILVDNFRFPILPFILITGVFGGCAVVYLWKLPREYSYDKRRHKQYLVEQASYNKERIFYVNMAKAEEKKIAHFQKQLSHVQQLRQQVYSVNIIPSKYRNLHAAYYLFTYFSSCEEDDLGRVIQTMLLDDIIQRLDKIIEQNEEILLNQRYQIALQEHQNDMNAKNHRLQMEAIARIESDQERQMNYQQMIAQNQAVTNFFLTYDFLTKKK